MTDFNRPRDSFKYQLGGIKLNDAPNSIGPTKYAVGVNVRAYSDDHIHTRPGYTEVFAGGSAIFTDIRAYSALQTDNLPRILARDAADNIYLDTGAVVGTLAGSGASPSAVLIPFRPNASPGPWMYIANGYDYQKFSAPAPVVQQKVGIAEPQVPPRVAQPSQFQSLVYAQYNSPVLTPGGTAGATSSIVRVLDTAGQVFNDPVTGAPLSVQISSATGIVGFTIDAGGADYHVGDTGTILGGDANATYLITSVGSFDTVTGLEITYVGSGYATTTGAATSTSGSGVGLTINITAIGTAAYQRYMSLINGPSAGTGTLGVVYDVFPPIPPGIAIQAIYYFAGTSGRCIVVPGNLPSGPGTEGQSLYSAQLLMNLRRGSLIMIGTEICLVWSVTDGPGGSISIETSTTATHTAAEMLSGVAAIQFPPGALSGPVLSSTAAQSIVATGIGTLTATFSVNPFVYPAESFAFQPDDYIHISLNVNDLTKINEIKLLIDVGDGTFTQNFYYYTIRPSDLQQGVDNTLTQLAVAQIVSQRATIDEEDAAEANNQGQTASSAQTVPGSSQWSEIFFPISALTRVGNDQTKTLANAIKWQVLVNANDTVIVQVNSFSILGGYGPDVGAVGSPYVYRVRPRSSVTGAVGNPSPAVRYGVNPRRGAVNVYPPSAVYDPQIDTWDVFRYGGSVTEFRYIGSIPTTATVFTDIYDDSAAQAGDALDFDNFEPWPSVDLPQNGTAASIAGTTAIIPSTDANITSWLPGTLVQFGGQNAYTLWARPVSLGGGNYLLQFVENAGASTAVPFTVQEPFLANRHLPYMWGPDASGTVFAVGDQYRPGTFYFAKPYAPDSAPDSYNQELTSPSEPLLGGLVVDGLSYVGSTERWWALYPQPDNPSQRFNPVEQPFTRGPIAPSAICTDGKNIYWVARDGIYSSGAGSLTDADLYNLFPHEGVPGRDITYNGVTVQAPDYSRVGSFRLAYSNGYLYATYKTFSGAYAAPLICNTRNKSWSVDQYYVPMTTFYGVEQQAESAGTLNPVLLMAGYTAPSTAHGAVYKQTVNTNDGTAPIACILSTFEFDAGDLRAPKQWGDLWLDATPAAQGSGLTLTPLSQGAAIGGPIAVPVSATRVRQPLDIGGEVVADFLGLYATWTDDFSVQTVPTRLYAWQPSFIIQPARGVAWYTFGTTFSLNGYMHVRQLLIAWVSTAAITVTITSYDGQSPAVFTIPSSSGQYQKATFIVSANKGLLYKFQAKSSAAFQLFMDDTEIYMGQWGRGGPYAVERNLGGIQVASGVV